jgi:amino acid transporter
VLAVTLIRRHRPDIRRPFRMWLYPVPSILTLLGWIWILLSSGWDFIGLGFAILIFGIAGYLLLSYQRREWPFQSV